ncbi:MAG: hypothetical protein LH629_16565, partial [Ignavibacteria bacterium]|nr:hypothetical protein [Ignavibacteria bacterium]
TLDRGLRLFNEVADSLQLKDTKIFPGDEAFKLYDTFGFPFDLTEVMAKEKGLKVDLLKFEEDMAKQKERGKSARKDFTSEADLTNSDIIKSHIVNYNPYNITDELETELLFSDPKNKTLVIKDNPFYSESGGQISDTGKIIFNSKKEISVIDSKKDYLITEDNKDIFSGNAGNKKVIIKVDLSRRQSIERNHSATHILHEALRRILGSHVKQLGSLVHNEYLRFDFPHFHKLEESQINELENLINSKIQEEIKVITNVDMSIDEANEIPNVKKFFGDKYGDKVRVVTIDKDFSIEFCGGTHVKNTNDIGLFKITKEESIASGTRRIFARTGEGIINLFNEKISDIEKIISDLPEVYSGNFKSGLDSFKKDISKADFRDIKLMQLLLHHQNSTVTILHDTREKYLEEKKILGKQLLKQNLVKAFEDLDKLILKSNKENGFDIITAKMELTGMDEFKEIGEALRNKIKNGIGLIAVVLDGKINLVCSVSDNLIKEKNINAG